MDVWVPFHLRSQNEFVTFLWDLDGWVIWDDITTVGSKLPANPAFVYPVPILITITSSDDINVKLASLQVIILLTERY